MYVFVRKHFFIKGKANSFEFTEETADFLLGKKGHFQRPQKRAFYIFWEHHCIHYQQWNIAGHSTRAWSERTRVWISVLPPALDWSVFLMMSKSYNFIIIIMMNFRFFFNQLFDVCDENIYGLLKKVSQAGLCFSLQSFSLSKILQSSWRKGGKVLAFCYLLVATSSLPSAFCRWAALFPTFYPILRILQILALSSHFRVSVRGQASHLTFSPF